MKNKPKLWNKNAKFKKFKNITNGDKLKLWNEKLYRKKNKKLTFIKLNGGTAKGIPFSASLDAAFNISFVRFLSHQRQDNKNRD